MYSPIHHLASTLMVNIQSTFQTAPDLCKNVSVAVLLGSNGNSYTISRVKCLYTHTHTAHSKDAGQAKKKGGEGGQQWMLCAKEIFPHDILGTCSIGSPALVYIYIY